MNYKDYIRDIPDFPKAGILYRDIQPLLSDPVVFENIIKDFANLLTTKPAYIVGIDARGFIFASALALHLKCGVKLIRKKGKLPNPNLVSASYKLEYGEDSLEMVQEGKGESCVLIDDVLATGGTINAAVELIDKAGYNLIEKLCLVDIGLLPYTDIKSLIRYE